jgi:hypothetical protein
MVVTTDIPYMQDRLNTKRMREMKNTPRTEYNCGGYALDTFSWYCPFSRKDWTIGNLLERFDGDYTAVLQYTVDYMLKEFKGKLRLIQSLAELQEGEEAVGYRIVTSCWDFHYVRRKQNGSWYGKMGACPKIYRYTEEQVFDYESEAWRNGRYDSEMILFALIVK